MVVFLNLGALSMSSDLVCMISRATIAEIGELARLEAESFPADEAASPESIQHRVEQAGRFFSTYKSDQQIVGFVNGTCINGGIIEEDSMSEHHPSGQTLVVHSVTVAEQHRRRGIGSQMLKAYVDDICTIAEIQTILLLCKTHLLTFYIGCGFSLVGLSSVQHGQDRWYEMKLDLVEKRGVQQLQVDAFALKPFSGNPAAVIFQHKDDRWMQNVAMENNLAETSFLSKLPDKENSYALRWFTPAKEVDLCGHATLAAAHALYETGRVPRLQRIEFHTVYSGLLTAQGKADGTIEMDFPATPVEPVLDAVESVSIGDAIQAALGLANKDCIIFIGKSMYDIVVEITREAFAEAKRTPIQINALQDLVTRGVLITCLGGRRAASSEVPIDDAGAIVTDPRFDFLSRGFFPRFGIPEDPVTGSAHCALAPYWAMKLPPAVVDVPELAVDDSNFTGTRASSGTNNSSSSNSSNNSNNSGSNCSSSCEGHGQSMSMVGYQASNRGGVVRVTLRGDRVLLSGPCVTTMRTTVIV